MSSEQGQHRVKIPWFIWDAIEDKTPMRTHIVVGGIGSGKSYGGQIWDIARAQENGVPVSDPKPSKSWTVAPNYRICETLFELTLEVASKIFNLSEGSGYEIKRAFPRTIDLAPSGINHRILFLSADRPELFVSDSITHWRWSEAAVSKAMVFDKIRDRLRDSRAVCPSGMIDSTPEGTSNHFYDIAGFIGEKREALDEKRNFRVYRTETGDNAANLSPGYVDMIRSRYAHRPELIMSYEKGLFVPLTSSLSAYWEWRESRNVIDPVPASENLPLLLCFDFNVSPLAWVVAQEFITQKNYYSPRLKRYVALEESDGEARGLLDAIANFANVFPSSKFGNTLIRVHGDASGWARNHQTGSSDYSHVEQYLRSLGYRRIEFAAPTQNPAIRHRLEKTAALMAYERFAVCSNCTRLRAGFAKTTLKEGAWDLVKPGRDDWTHYPDAITYALFQEAADIEVTRPNSRRILGATM